MAGECLDFLPLVYWRSLDEAEQGLLLLLVDSSSSRVLVDLAFSQPKFLRFLDGLFLGLLLVKPSQSFLPLSLLGDAMSRWRLLRDLLEESLFRLWCLPLDLVESLASGHLRRNSVVLAVALDVDVVMRHLVELLSCRCFGWRKLVCRLERFGVRCGVERKVCRRCGDGVVVVDVVLGIRFCCRRS